MPLPLVGNDLNLEATALGTTAPDLASTDASIHKVLDIPLQPATKVLVQGAAAGENNVLVEAAADVDRALLDDAIDDDREGRKEVGRVNFGVEEDLGGQESLVSDVDGDLAAAGLPDDVLGEAAPIAIEARKLLDNVGAHIAVFLLDLLGRLQRAVGLAPVSQ